MSYGQQARAETRFLESGHACEPGCTGRWHLSDFDTWHACCHGDPGLHPEVEQELWEEERRQLKLAPLRERYLQAARALQAAGVTRQQLLDFPRELTGEKRELLAVNMRNAGFELAWDTYHEQILTHAIEMWASRQGA